MARKPLPNPLNGSRVAAAPLEVRVVLRARGAAQYCFICGKSVLRLAVSRNRWKRILREIVRTNRISPPAGYQFLVKLRSTPALPLHLKDWEGPAVRALSDAARRVRS